ncbi:hypothetical protein MMUR_52600 [Mycolicibacterium murale]|uniref:histidine kinase n=1 Tax=Mycolicibacterium murale TaxID=182220 RepID=A0A7I9WTU1_9MYCO|nr:hypothetical protein MMUR_52600 [Mycolicibacterium murale]
MRAPGHGRVAVTHDSPAPMFDQPGLIPPAGPVIRKPARWSLSNWPVRWKVAAIAAIPLLLAAVFGGVRVYASAVEARDLAAAADRTELVPAIDDYMAALQDALVATASGGDTATADTDYQARSTELQERVDSVDPVSDVRLAVTDLLTLGRQLVADAGSSPLPEQVSSFSPLLLTAETAITGSVRGADESVRVQAEGLARAVGARGQMAMQRLLVQSGGAVGEPELRSSMVALAGTEPSTVRGMAELLGPTSEEAATLRSQMVQRLDILSDPAAPLTGNPQLLQSIQTTDDIAARLVDDTASGITAAVRDEAADARADAIRDAAVVVLTFLLVVLIVVLVARSLTRPLRRLRDGALSIAHRDLVDEIERVKAGDEREPDPLPIHTTEEIGQVAHAVDELHTQALLLAGDEARLRVTVNDMFETMSRRNKSLVDQQLSLIDRLERNEEDPGRLDSLFRLDHLATRMRRNGANLLVLAGAQISREHSAPEPLPSLIAAAASEVEDYQRVHTRAVPDCSVVGSVAGDAVHLLAELIDNALRYSPPSAQVRVNAVHTSNGGVLVDVEDDGLGMTDGDLRIANMRLTAGGEVTPDSARHMGLFVVGRLARQHGMTVQLLVGDTGSGTKAQLYVPPELLENVTVAPQPEPEPEPAPPAVAPSLFDAPAPEPADESGTALPRRTPGSSGITGEPPAADEQPAWWPGEGAARSGAPADTSEFFSSRRRAQWEAQEETGHAEPEPAEPATSDVDLIYQNMMSEWLVDPEDLQQLATPQDWKSVWDNGWATAAEVEDVPVENHTDHGLPVRQPGARLVPGGTSAGTPEQTSERDPDAIRASLGAHFSGVHAGRTHGSDTPTEGPDQK